ncbi:MAG: hypothetical protein GOP50_00750 [Candidatus Heimdallarchaeota archaeon]|nr:hypothetical protein [Candidatus Heimdallarchaeota archaeon]
MIHIKESESIGILTQPSSRKSGVKKVPFVEFHDNKIQGVVSSGSSLERVYVCVLDFNKNTFTCHTNNNRPCGGLRGSMCSHLSSLMSNAGNVESIRNLGLLNNTYNLRQDGSARYSEVFTRFQERLRFLELDETQQESIPETRWFHSKSGQMKSESVVNLYDLTDNLDKTTKLTQELSYLFYNGFSKLIQKEKEKLSQLADGFKNSPLREIVPQGLEKLQKNDFNKDNFTALVLAITSVYGAVHDALYDQAKEVVGEKTIFHTPEDSVSFDEYDVETRTLLDNIQNWLIDLAIRGFSDLNKESIISFETVLQTIEDNVELKRLGVILRGLTNEILLVLSDTKNEEHAIQLRWMDLWCKAYLLTIKKQAPAKGTKVTGKLKLVGLQTHVHTNFLTVVFNGILEVNKENIYVEIEKSKFIIDLIPIEEFWHQIKTENAVLFDGLLTSKIISVKNGNLFQNGNLISEDFKATAKTFVLSEEVEKIVGKSLSISKAQSIDRHPIHFKVPFVIDEKEIKGNEVKVGEKVIPIRYDHQPVKRKSALNKSLIELRFDNGWYFKPLTSMGGTNQFLGQLTVKPTTTASIYALLKERSSKILRDKK